MNEKVYQGDSFRRERLDAGGFPRHRHDFGYMCLVLGGRFVEAGDSGRFRVEAGDVLVHRPFEAHMDLFGEKGADVLNLPLPPALIGEEYLRVPDADAIARLAERDTAAAAEAVAACALRARGEEDWPDRLADALRGRTPIAIGEWASRHGLAPATVSRGFRQAYGTTPARYRAEVRARRAWQAAAAGIRPLAELAFDLDFSDQAHMTRCVVQITGLPPGRWRRGCQTGSRPAGRSAIA